MTAEGLRGRTSSDQFPPRVTSLLHTRISIVVLSLYFVAAPFEDLLSSYQGTLLKYLALLFSILVILDRIRARTPILRKDSLVVFALALLLLSWLSSVWSIDLDRTISRNVAYSLLLLFFVVGYSTTLTARELRFLRTSVILGGAGLSGYVLLLNPELTQTDYGRLVITDSNDPNNLAALMLLPLILSLFTAFARHDRRSTFLSLSLAGIATLVFSYIILLTGSRGGLLSVGIALVVFALSSGFSDLTRRVAVLVFGLSIVVLLVIPRLPPNLSERLFQADSYVSDVGQSGLRFDVWSVVVRHILPELPAWGVGSGNAPLLLSQWFGVLKGVHNTYLNMVIEYGVFGLPLFLAILLVLGVRSWRARDFERLALLAAICVSIFFLDSFAKKFLWNALLYVALGLPILANVRDDESRVQRANRREREQPTPGFAD